MTENDLVERLRKRAEIRRQISTRKSVMEGQPDRISDLLEEASNRIDELENLCAESYCVVGQLLMGMGLFDSKKGQKILDNLAEHKIIHTDILPFHIDTIKNKEIAHLQAKIDSLMLEYCPEEMTKEQLDNWGDNQVTYKDHEIREFVNELTKTAKEYGHTQQLRSRISEVVHNNLKG
jgi:hypothetical protein